MKGKKILAILMTTMLSFSIAACSKDAPASTGTQGGNKTEPAQSTAGTTAQTTTEPKKEERYTTLKNPNIKIVYWQSKEQYEQVKKDNPNAFDAILETIPEFEKKYGGKVELIATEWGQMLEKTTAMQNAGEAPDLFMVSDQTFHNVVTKGVVQPIDAFTADEDYSFWKVGRDIFTWKGKTYAVPIKPYFKHIIYNKTLFEENGLKTPKEYYKEGNWTFETFAEVGKALTKDTDGDGKTDQWGFTSWQDAIPAFMLCNGGAFLKVTTDSISSGLKDPATQEAMKFISEWTKAPDAGGFMNFGINMYETYDSGKLAMAVGKEYPAPTLPFESDMVPYPVGPSNKDKAVFVYPQGWSVPTGAKNPEGAVAFMYLLNKTTKAIGDEREIKNIGKENFDMINDPNLKFTYSMDKGLSTIWNIIGTAHNYMVDQLPPATIAEKLEPAIKADIEKTYGAQK